MYKQISSTYYEVWSKIGHSKLPDPFTTKEDAEKAIIETINKQIQAGFTPCEWKVMRVDWQVIYCDNEIVYEAQYAVKV